MLKNKGFVHLVPKAHLKHGKAVERQKPPTSAGKRDFKAAAEFAAR
jgi:hypothetical protein